METSQINKREILSRYMEYVLENGEQPKSIYAFTKQLEIEETFFYDHYNSFEDIAQDVYATFYDETIKLISNDESYEKLDAKNKLLVFYFTFFELLAANRSYVLLTFKENRKLLKIIKILTPLKNKFTLYVKGLEIDKICFQEEQLNNISNKGIEEMAWSQFLMTLRFWLEDSSPSFEKTDIFIEKSVNASFELLDITPLKNIIDFGKFFFKEKIKPFL